MKVFDAFRLDTVNHSLWRGEERLSLAPKAFDVLRYLVEHADRLVTQDEILEALWPDTYVNPEVVKKYVLGIRKVLGDQTSKPVFVATFPRRGYQFIAPVREESDSHFAQAATGACGKIVGRDDALSQLKDALHKTLQGQRQIIFVTGEAGIGKTTLLDAFQQTAGFGEGLKFARGQCVEGFGGKEAYYPVLEALGQLFRDADDRPNFDAFSKRAPTWLVQFPSLVTADQREALQKEIIGATRERMVREICEALEAMTAQHPLVVCLEDLHWVDASTLDFISALARRRAPAKLLLLGTYRPADVILSQSPLRALKQDLVLHGLSNEIALERLEVSDVAEYLAMEFAGASFPEGFAAAIYRHSGGNALFMVTILQDMVKKALSERAGEEWRLTVPLEDAQRSVPETLDQLIEAQFRQLTSQEQRILRSASVSGDRFCVWTIATAVELEPDAIEEACEQLCARLQFIKSAGIHELPTGQISAHYEFRHSLYREVLYRRLPELSRAKLHRALALRLQKFCDPCEQELATELALHFEGGHDYAQAARYMIVAAQNAAGRLAHRDSIEILQHALELVAKCGANCDAQLEIQILEALGDTHFVLGAMTASSHAYQAAASRSSEAGLKTMQVRALTRAMNPFGFFDPDQGIAALQQAVEVGTGIDEPLLLARTQLLAAAYRLVFDAWRQEDADLCDSAHRTLLHLGDTDARSYHQMIYALVLTLQGKCREALQTFEAGISGSSQEVSAISRYIALLGKTTALLQMGHLGEVLRISHAEKARAIKNGSAPWMFDFREAWVRTLAFDFQGTLQICETVRPKAHFLSAQFRCIELMALGSLDCHRQDYRKAVENFRQVRDPALTPKYFLHWIWLRMAERESGNAYLLSGDLSRARVEADGFLKAVLSSADPSFQALAWELKTRVAMAEHDLKGAREYLDRALALVDKFEILIAAWQTHATAWQFYRHQKENKTAEANRRRAEAAIQKIADSFESDDPLRATFLAAAPIRQVLRENARIRAAR